MSATEFLTTEDLALICELMGYGPIADAGLLAFAAARPSTSVWGEDAYPTLVLRGAALLESICRNHALVDGNKRLGLHALTVFLDLNGYDLDLDDDGRFDLAYEVADGTLRGIEAIAARMPLRSR